MDKKIAIELIKLEVLNRCNIEDSEAIQFLKHNDEDFPWNEHGEFQNLLAVLSLRPTLEMPNENLRQDVINRACQLKNIVAKDNKSEELNFLSNESTAIRLHEKESAEPGILPKVHTSVLGIPSLEESKDEGVTNENQFNVLEVQESNQSIENEILLDQNEELSEVENKIPNEDKEIDLKQDMTNEISEVEEKENLFEEDLKNEFTGIEEEAFTRDPINEYNEVEKDVFTEDERIYEGDLEEENPDEDVFKNDLLEESSEVEKEVFPVYEENLFEQDKTEEFNAEGEIVRSDGIHEFKEFENEVLSEDKGNISEEDLIEEFSKVAEELVENNLPENLNEFEKEGFPEKDEKVFEKDIQNYIPAPEEKVLTNNIHNELSELEKELFIENEEEEHSAFQDELVEIKDKQHNLEENLFIEEDGIIKEEGFIEEVKDEIEEHENKSKNITARLDDLILSRQPKLFKFQDFEESNSDEEIKEEEKVLNHAADHIDLEKNLDVKVKIPSDKPEVKEPVIPKEISQPVPELKKVVEKKQTLDTKLEYDVKTPRRSTKSSLIIAIALIIITVPVIFFLGSSKEEVTENANNTVNKESFVGNVELPKVTSEVSQVIEEKPLVKEKENTIKETETDKTELPPPLPDPVFVEPEVIEKIEDTPQKNSEQNESTSSIVPPKEEKIIESEPVYFVAVEEMPEPVGGVKGIQSKIKYPEIAKRVGIQGKVFVAAFVDETGTVTNVELLKGLGGGCDEEAMDAVRQTKFIPGKQRGKPVKVRISIPIVFKMQ